MKITEKKFDKIVDTLQYIVRDCFADMYDSGAVDDEPHIAAIVRIIEQHTVDYAEEAARRYFTDVEFAKRGAKNNFTFA